MSTAIDSASDLDKKTARAVHAYIELSDTCKSAVHYCQRALQYTTNVSLFNFAYFCESCL